MPNSPATILVVDDNPATLYATSRVLKGAGFRVLEAETGEAAIAVANQEIVDLVVLDINLPGIDGFEVVRQLRAHERLASIPVIHLSATFVKETDKVHGLEGGADGYLTHPVEPPVLIATVNAFLRAQEAERGRRQRELEFRAIFERALNGIALITKELVFVDVNPAMCEILQAERGAIVSRSVLDFTPGDRREEAAEIFRRLGTERTWRGVFPLQALNGQPVYLEWNLSKHSVPDRWLAVVSDISSRLAIEREREELLISERTARTEAERANRLKDDFLATLSHELRTPLNAIVGWAQLLKLGQLDPTGSQNAIEAIDRNAKAQAQMIADLLDVARISSGKIRLEVKSVDPTAVIEAALEAVMPAIEAKDIRLTKAFDSQATPVSGDPGRLQQVVWNLVSNAVKFTPRGGQIEIALKRSESQIELSVTDDGQGIPDDLLPNIFDRFRQGDASTTRSEGGLGLGLSIAKQIVELHGGTIQAESAGKGRGATFRVLLPLGSQKSQGEHSVADWPVRASKVGGEDMRARLSGVRVLIVDDDADARHLTKLVLSDFGADPEVAGGVEEALVALDRFDPHVLVSDLGMPTQDGFRLIREVRARGYSFQRLPAIALTAFARSEDRQKALRAGFQLHLVKPVDAAELSAAIAALIGRTG
ncbi:MAG TPA: response regulator [Planctomycetaceae bacterium]|jgi:PAS domain S-box-containing protein|nr:response regulator [Planctomycetaceae bacterium]